jgi:hypothetical protein
MPSALFKLRDVQQQLRSHYSKQSTPLKHGATTQVLSSLSSAYYGPWSFLILHGYVLAYLGHPTLAVGVCGNRQCKACHANNQAAGITKRPTMAEAPAIRCRGTFPAKGTALCNDGYLELAKAQLFDRTLNTSYASS